MSYILDALKKADQERRMNRAPDLMTDQGPGTRKQRRNAIVYFIVVILVAAGGAAGWYLGHEESLPVQKAQPINQLQPVAQTQNISGEMDPAPIKQSSSSVQTQASPQKSTTQDANKTAEKKKSAVKHNEEKASKLQPVNPSDPVTKEPALAPVKKKPENKIYSISELPEEIKQGIPPIAISTHIYSEVQSERLASVNGHIGREGQEITAGLVLDSVTPDGVILKYQGYRFSVRLH